MYLATLNDYVQRTSSLISPYQNSTTAFWVKHRSATSGLTPSYRDHHWLGDDPALYYQFAQNIWHGEGGIVTFGYGLHLEFYNGVTVAGIDKLGYEPLNTWAHIAVVTSGTLRSLYYYGELIGTPTSFAYPGPAYTHEILGSDTFCHTDMDFVYARQWTAALAQAEIIAEMTSQTAVRTADLWYDTPLTANLNDISGNARHWSAVGAPTFPDQPLFIVGRESVAIAEFFKGVVNPLVIRRHEFINFRDSLRIVAPTVLEIRAHESISVKDVKPSLAPDVLVINVAEEISVTEGPLNTGAVGNAAVIGPEPAPVTIPADYWEVGV